MIDHLYSTQYWICLTQLSMISDVKSVIFDSIVDKYLMLDQLCSFLVVTSDVISVMFVLIVVIFDVRSVMFVLNCCYI